MDASPVLARYAATNSLIEGVYQGSLGEAELLGKEYRDYSLCGGHRRSGFANHLYAVNCKIYTSYGSHRDCDF